MTMLQHGSVPSTGGYQIERSLRFNSADSAYLNRTPASAGNRKKWTWSGWVKRSALTASTYFQLFCARTSGSPYDFLYFYNDGLSFETSVSLTRVTTQVFRDPSAWYHIMVAVDTTQATANDRAKIYVNGSQITAFNTITNCSQDADLATNSTVNHWIGASPAGEYYNGYMADVYLIDGSALTPSSFGENDTDTGVWKPKAYSGTYGTNGFYLKFADNSGTTSTTLGKDSSGNGNNWTPNNFSVTAGAGNDSLVDTPTPYGTDTGAGGEVRGNYSTLNPLANNGGTLANGNLDHTGTTAITASTLFPSTGKWYCEFTCTAYGGGGSLGYTAVGVIQSSQSINTVPNSLANVPVGLWIYRNDANKANNGASASYGNTWTANDVIGIAVDLDAGKLWFAKNGTWQASGDPAAGTNAAYTNLSGSIAPAINDQGVYSSSFSFNAGQRPFAYTAPSGFKALCTTNLPTPTIGATSTTRANKYFNPVIYTGTGGTLAVTGVGFQPDFTWIKDRTNAYSHALNDAVRGAGKTLVSNATDSEYNYAIYFNSFDTDGFTVAQATQLFNTNGDSYISWNWKANGAGSSNTQGTITSTVSANTTSGFSIVTYTNASSGTVGHGLGVAPAMVIYKDRTNVTNWVVLHKSLTNMSDYYLRLNTTDSVSSGIGLGGAPTSSVIYTNTNIIQNSAASVAYCFAPVAGYSAFGSYVGNGSADGSFVYTGFRPAYILIKKSSTSGGNWWVIDNKRDAYNVTTKILAPSLSDAESSGTWVDFTSNGFKIRTASSDFNDSGQTHVYAAFAEVPTKFALAR